METVSNYEQQIQFIIGFAGSGKSTKLAEIAKGNTDVMVLTPTHKAADVLKSKGLKHVHTIHSALKLVPTINQEFRKGQRMQRLKQVGDTELSQIDKILIDEFSMINTEMLDMLLDVLPTHCKVIVFGDPYQLATIEGDSIDPLAYTDNIIELTKQRRSNAPTVVETFMRFKDYLRDGTGRDLTIKPNNKDLVKGTLKDFNPATDRILAYTNARVIALNNQVAKQLGKPTTIQYNEPIVLNTLMGELVLSDYNQRLFPNCVKGGELMPEKDLLKNAKKAQGDIDKYHTDLSKYKQSSVVVDNEVFLIYYDEDHYANQKKYKEAVEKYQHLLVETHNIGKKIKLADWCRQNPKAKYVRERAKAWSTYLSHSNYVFSVRRPYATTVHKAQGSEFTTVFIDQADMKKSIRNGYYETYARLMYVAMSRAIEKVIVL